MVIRLDNSLTATVHCSFDEKVLTSPLRTSKLPCDSQTSLLSRPPKSSWLLLSRKPICGFFLKTGFSTSWMRPYGESGWCTSSSKYPEESSSCMLATSEANWETEACVLTPWFSCKWFIKVIALYSLNLHSRLKREVRIYSLPTLGYSLGRNWAHLPENGHRYIQFTIC